MTHPDSNIFRRKHWKGGKKKVGKMRKRVEPIVSTPDKESVFFKKRFFQKSLYIRNVEKIPKFGKVMEKSTGERGGQLLFLASEEVRRE